MIAQFRNTDLKTLVYISFLALLLFAPHAARAQDDDKPTFPLENFYAKRKGHFVRAVYHNFWLGVSTGYGNTTFNSKLKGFGVFQRPGYAPRIFDSGTPTAPVVGTKYSNWVNTVVQDTLSVKPGNFLVISDTAKLGFKGHAFNIPIKLTLHYALSNYRLGGGYSWEYMSIGELHSIAYKNNIADFRPGKHSGFMKKYFVMGGITFLRRNEYLFTADANIGVFQPGKNFTESLVKHGLYANVGVTVERELSEYLRAFVRPSYDIKKYTLSIPESGKTLSYNFNAFYLNFGFSYTLPRLPRCYNKNCHAQVDHAHGDKEYRSAMHKIWKWQNPHYGQNNPNLIKYKGRNKKKLNPY